MSDVYYHDGPRGAWRSERLIPLGNKAMFGGRSFSVYASPVQEVSGSTAYSAYIFTIRNGGGGYSYSISAGALPTGLTLNTATGIISGTATFTEEVQATFQITDAHGRAASTGSITFDVLATNPVYSNLWDQAYWDEGSWD